jgi:hypothetical protein
MYTEIVPTPQRNALLSNRIHYPWPLFLILGGYNILVSSEILRSPSSRCPILQTVALLLRVKPALYLKSLDSIVGRVQTCYWKSKQPQIKERVLYGE